VTTGSLVPALGAPAVSTPSPSGGGVDAFQHGRAKARRQASQLVTNGPASSSVEM